MLKQRLILTAAIIACLCLVGCAAVPKARITHVDSFTVAKALCEKGTARTERTANDSLAAMMAPAFPLSTSDPNSFVTYRTVWPDPAVIHNNQKMTIKYDLSQGFFNSRRCKDTISLIVQQPNETILLVKCQTKDINGFLGSFFDYYFGFLNPFYKRNHEREHMLMTSTAQQLQTEHQAQVEWLGKWRPEPDNP